MISSVRGTDSIEKKFHRKFLQKCNVNSRFSEEIKDFSALYLLVNSIGVPAQKFSRHNSYSALVGYIRKTR